MDLMKLQNGSDIRGVALEGVPGETVNFSVSEAHLIAKAFGLWLEKKLQKPLIDLRVALGTDSRLTGPALKAAAVDSLANIGISIWDCNIASTPAMFMSTIFEETAADGAIMFTASHLPFNRNGMKFFTAEGGLEKSDIKELLEIAQGLVSPTNRIPATHRGIVMPYDLLGRYSDHLVEIIRSAVPEKLGKNEPLRGFKIIVDAGNGSGGFFTDILETLGADTTGSQFLDPDGHFPNHVPNPEDKEAMASVVNATLAAKADLGIIFDTDVDRAAIVDGAGRPINRNRLIALLSAIVFEKYPGSTIVTDSVTSDGLTDFIEKSGGVHHRFKRGYKNVINESIRLNANGIVSPLAIETSGHGAFKDNYFLDDGAYIVTQILIKMADLHHGGNTLSELIQDLSEPVEEKEFRVKITTPDFKSYGDKVLAELRETVYEHAEFQVAAENHEGLRVNWKNGEGKGYGWFLVRMSLHDPVMPINIESEYAGGIDEVLPFLKKFFGLYSNLDATAIKASQ